MSTIKFKGSPVHTIGNLPQTGSTAPAFSLTKTNLSESTLTDYKGKKVVLNIFPSLDTSVCAASVRHFNAEAEKLPGTVILCISKDLPFAHSRFCASEGLKNVINLSEFKDFEFGKNYGVTMTDGPLAGLFSRVVIVLNEEGKVVYTEQVPEIAQEPDYARALAALT